MKKNFFRFTAASFTLFCLLSIPNLEAARWRVLPSDIRYGKFGHFIFYDDQIDRIASVFGMNTITQLNDIRESTYTPETNWQYLPSAGPFIRAYPGAASSDSKKTNYIFGGYTRNFLQIKIILGDLWSRTPNGWQKLYQYEINSPTGPTPRSSPGLAFDERRDRLVLFGGEVAPNQAIGDLWEWNGNGWIQISLPPTSLPPARYGHSMVYDPIKQRVFVFGGKTSQGATLNDLWSWDGKGTWKKELPLSSALPSPRAFSSMVYSLHNNQLIVFGGTSEGNISHNDLWAWGNDRWVELPVSDNQSRRPGARSGAGIVYHPRNQTILVHGGIANANTALYDTWELIQ